MRILGRLLAVALLLASVACTRGVAGTPAADDAAPPPEESSEVSAEPEDIPECVDCDADVVEAAIDNPVVVQAKRVDTTPKCEVVMPLPTISQIVGAVASSGDSGDVNECHAVYETADLSRVGQVWLSFSGPTNLEPVAVDEFEGNTLIESQISNQVCEYGLAIDDALDKYDHGSWLALRVMSGDGNPPPCGLAHQLIEIAFQNLPDA